MKGLLSLVLYRHARLRTNYTVGGVPVVIGLVDFRVFRLRFDCNGQETCFFEGIIRGFYQRL
jgi:hypothetical protein